MLISAFITFRIAYNSTRSLVKTSSQEINKQIILNFENYLSDVIDISNTLQKDMIDIKSAQDWQSLQDVFGYLTEIDQNIRAVALYQTDGEMILSSSTLSTYNAFEEPWFQAAITNKDIYYFSNPHIELHNDQTKEVITISKEISYMYENVDQTGVLIIDVSTDDLVTLATMTNLGDDGHLIIINHQNELVYSSNESLTINHSLDIANELILGGDFVEINGQIFYISVNTIKYTRWKIATVINANQLTSTSQNVMLAMIAVFFGTVIIITVSTGFYSSRITKPMHILEGHIKKIESGDFDTRIVLDGQKEVVLLADAFNQMSDQIKQLMNRIVKEQDEKRKTQFIALQNQINPHFLYNTLDSIVYLSEKHKNKEVEKSIIALSKFFRMSITDEMNLVNLADEIEHVISYLTIQQIRYSNQFSYDMNIDPALLHYKVLKLSLQPLVENAILHGIHPDDEFTHIHIRATQQNGYIYLSVMNEGYGIDETRINDIYKMIRGEINSKSIGLKNVYQRLILYYGERADLIITSKLDESTTVTMKMPITKEVPS